MSGSPAAGRVLVVDDEPRWRAIFHDTLAADGVEVDVTAETARALELLRERQYGLVLLDVVLAPTGDTLDCQRFLEALKSDFSPLPVVATTGKLLEPPEVALICRYGVVEFLYKPRIRVGELRQLVRDILAGHLPGSGRTAPAASPRYDAFVSYHRRDRDWVTGTLVPALEAAGLRVCVDHRDFRPGSPTLVEVERAVRESRCTVLVLTPDYLSGDSTALEAVLGKTAGASAPAPRAVPVLLRPCDPPPRLRALTYLDFTADPRRGTELARLVAAIRLPI